MKTKFEVNEGVVLTVDNEWYMGWGASATVTLESDQGGVVDFSVLPEDLELLGKYFLATADSLRRRVRENKA